MKNFRCVVCGYVHEGESAPAQCPICKVGADKFEEIAVKAETPAPQPKEEPKNEVFTLGSVPSSPKPQVLGKIDLDSINQQTRPKKKSKEERRKEREAKQQTTPAAGGANSATAGERKKRKRINKDRVDIEKTASTIGANPERRNQPAAGGGNANPAGKKAAKPNKQP